LLIAGFYFYWEKNSKGTAELSWNPNTEQNLKGYKIYFGTAPRNNNCPPGGYPGVVDTGTSTRHVFNGLKNHATYYFSVTSYNAADKESCFSEEVKKYVKAGFFDKFKK
jgi:hypothetical protein